MMSSSQHLDPLPVTTTRAKRLPLSPDEAAAVLAGNQLNRGVRILGPSNPGSSGRAYASDNVATGAYQDPILRLGGIVTVNSSVNSIAHVPALASDGGGAVVSGTTSAATITGTTAAATTTGTTSTALGAVTANAGTIATPATAALPVTAGAVSTTGTGLLTPTVSSAAVITPTPASSGLVSGPTTGTTRTVTAASTTNGTARTAAATTTGTTVTAASTSRTATATVAPIRISQDASGRVVVSNSSGKSQR